MGTIIAIVALALAVFNVIHTTHVGGKVTGIIQTAKRIAGGDGAAPDSDQHPSSTKVT